MKTFLLIIVLIALSCSPCRQCTSYIVDQEQYQRWERNGVRIEHVDTLKTKTGDFYEVYVK